jgi:hypothetical protein
MTISTTIDFTTNKGSQGLAGGNPIVFYEQYIDTDALNLGTDEYNLFDVPEGLMHLSTVVEVLTAEGGTATATIGIEGALTTFIAAGCDLNAAAGTIFTDVDAANASGGAAGGYVTPDGGITVLLDPQNAMDAGKFRVTQSWLDMRGQSTQMGDTA